MTSNGSSNQPAPTCVSRYRWVAKGKTYIVHANSDGSWYVAECDGRILAPQGSTHPNPMKIIKAGKSVGPEDIAADLTAWVQGEFGTDVRIKPY